MGKVIVLGVKQSTGNYQGIDYDNMVLQGVSMNTTGTGMQLDPVKFAVKRIPEVMGKSMTPNDWAALEGKEIRVYYGKNNKVDEIEILGDAPCIGQFFVHLNSEKK